jgi:hypothetical protein
MKKDYHYYHKRSLIYGITALALILLATIPILFHFTIVSKAVTMYIQLGLGLGSFTVYSFSQFCQRRMTEIRRAEKQQKKKEAFNNIIKLVKEQYYLEAVDALYDYDNKYNK